MLIILEEIISEISICMMVKIQKGRIITLIFLFTALSLVYFDIGNNLIDSDKISDKIEVRSFENDDLKYSKISSKIHVNNNWSDAKAAGICTGSGNWSDPFVIEDLIIDGQNLSSCILIENSDVYFRIENCTVYNSGSNEWNDAGIELRSVNNGELITNTANNNTNAGIYLTFSSNNTISGNTANNNSNSGIFLDYSSNNNTVSGNTANNNTDAGIHLDWSSSNNKISGNTANYNFHYAGIYLGFSDNNTISGNTVYNNRMEGIYLGNSNNNTISGNIASNNAIGIYLGRSNDNNISGNTANYNSIYAGIRLWRSDNNNISGNTANYNNLYGIQLWYSNNNTISRNDLAYNTLQAINEKDAFGNIFENNIVDVPADLSSLNLVFIIIGFSIILLILGSGFIYVMKDKKKKSIQSELIATEEEEKEELLSPTQEIKPEFNIFISYSTLDSKHFLIQKCVKNLEKFPEIEKAYFWEVDSKENIVEFMDETLKKTNIFVLFCTENSMKSNSVKNEWQAAFQRCNKGLMKIIPVYEDEDLVPPLLGHLLNVKFSKDDFKGFVEKLYQEILR